MFENLNSDSFHPFFSSFVEEREIHRFCSIIDTQQNFLRV